MSSFSPPGWNFRYGVTLYTFPPMALQASSGDLCSLSMEGVTRRRVSTPYELVNKCADCERVIHALVSQSRTTT